MRYTDTIYRNRNRGHVIRPSHPFPRVYNTYLPHEQRPGQVMALYSGYEKGWNPLSLFSGGKRRESVRHDAKTQNT